MSRYQYRLTVNGNVGPIQDKYPGEQWQKICDTDRIDQAKFERRLVTDRGVLTSLADAFGWISTGGVVIGPWETLAELTERKAIIIGGQS